MLADQIGTLRIHALEPAIAEEFAIRSALDHPEAETQFRIHPLLTCSRRAGAPRRHIRVFEPALEGGRAGMQLVQIVVSVMPRPQKQPRRFDDDRAHRPSKPAAWAA
jgi:hypothetical protein